MVSVFYKQVTREMAPKLAVSFRHLVSYIGRVFRHVGDQPKFRHVGDWSVAKKSSSSNVGDYRPISITPVLPKIFETIVAG